MPRPYEREYDDIGETRRRRRRRPISSGLPTWLPLALWLAGGLLPPTLLLIAAAVSGTRSVLMPLALITGALSCVGGWVWLMIVAAADSIGKMLMCIFVPFYGLYYVLNNLDQTIRPMMLYVLGIVTVVAGGYVPAPPPGIARPPEQVRADPEPRKDLEPRKNLERKDPEPRKDPAPTEPPKAPATPWPIPLPKNPDPPAPTVPKQPFAVDPQAKAAGARAYLAALTPFAYEAGPWKLGIGVQGDDLKTPIRVQKREYKYGFSTHPPKTGACRVSFVPGGEFKRFKGWAGISDNFSDPHGTVGFVVYGDGRKLWESAGVNKSGTAVGFDIDVTGVKVLTLESHMKDGFHHAAHASWLDPWFER